MLLLLTTTRTVLESNVSLHHCFHEFPIGKRGISIAMWGFLECTRSHCHKYSSENFVQNQDHHTQPTNSPRRDQTCAITLWSLHLQMSQWINTSINPSMNAFIPLKQGPTKRPLLVINNCDASKSFNQLNHTSHKKKGYFRVCCESNVSHFTFQKLWVNVSHFTFH